MYSKVISCGQLISSNSTSKVISCGQQILNNKVHRNNTLNNVDLGSNPSNIHVTNESLANLPSAEYVSAEQSSIPNISEPVPSLMLSNTMSLAPKIDEVRHSVLQTDVDLACFTETWLTDFVHDNVIQIPGYNVVRRDRLIGQHGGVCLYVKESIPFEILSQYHNDQFEVLWVKARPHKLPRGLSCIIIGSIYHPPSANDRNMIDFLTEQLSLIESTYYTTSYSTWRL